MSLKLERKVFACSGTLRINIPREIAKALKLKPRDMVSISLSNENQMVLEKRREGA